MQYQSEHCVYQEILLMNKYSFVIAPLLVLLCLASCKKEKGNPVDPGPIIDSPITYPNYTKLLPGNYWIYQDYKLDSATGPEHPLGTFDSVFVEKDTVINGLNYHKYWDVAFSGSGAGNGFKVSFLRDSLSYLVNVQGHILFSSTNFTTIFYTTTFGPNLSTPDTLVVTEQMGFKDATTTVDAGTFKTSSFRQIFHYPANYRYGATREYDYRYCLNVGLVSYTTGFYDSLPWVFERRLVRYHVL